MGSCSFLIFSRASRIIVPQLRLRRKIDGLLLVNVDDILLVVGLHILIRVVAENAEQLVVGLQNQKNKIVSYGLLVIVHLHISSEVHGLNLGKDGRSTHSTLGERAQTSSQHFFKYKSNRKKQWRRKPPWKWGMGYIFRVDSEKMGVFLPTINTIFDYNWVISLSF